MLEAGQDSSKKCDFWALYSRSCEDFFVNNKFLIIVAIYQLEKKKNVKLQKQLRRRCDFTE